MVEKWEAAPGFEGWYEVSNHGRIRRSRPGKATYVGKLLKLHRRKSGHMSVCLRADGKDRQAEVHRLVALAFVGPQPNGKEVNHIDGNPSNNFPENLEWVTRSENVAHAYRIGLATPLRGENAPAAKLIEHDVKMIRNSPLGTSALALHYGVSLVTIKRIRARQIWAHID